MRPVTMLIVFTLAVGCHDVEQARTPTEPTKPERSESSRVGLIKYECAPGSERPREVAAGTAEDSNGNGLVCDQNMGSPSAPLLVTLDDLMVISE